MALGLIRVPSKEFVDIPEGNPGGLFVAGYAAGSKAKSDGANLEQNKLNAVNQVANDKAVLDQRAVESTDNMLNDIERNDLMRNQQEIARMNALTGVANSERLAAEQQFGMQKEQQAAANAQAFTQGFNSSLEMMTRPQIPMRMDTREPPTLYQTAQAFQENLPKLQDPGLMMRGMSSVLGLESEARLQRGKVMPDSYNAVPIMMNGEVVGLQGPTGRIPLKKNSGFDVDNLLNSQGTNSTNRIMIRGVK